MTFSISRRRALAVGTGGLAATALGFSAPSAVAETNGFEELIKQFTGGRAPVPGHVNLDLPKIADDGASVPITITVDAPMTEQSYVKDILVVAEANPKPRVAVFHFSPGSGVAEVSTRIRLAQTENVVAIAKTNDGTVYMARKEVTVTVGGCGTS